MILSKLCAALVPMLALLVASPALAEEGAAAGSDEEVVRGSVSSLLFDVRKIVEVQASTGWKIDRYEYEAMMPNTLLSVCQATDETRSFALAAASREVARLGGPLEDALARNGNKVDDLEDLLFASRVEKLLAEAVRRAPTECPVWVKPRRDFRSLQAGVDRFFVAAEGGGQGMIQYAADHPAGTTGFTVGGGGGGRLLLGRGFGESWSLRFGPELSGKALVQRDGGATSLPLQFQGALPLVVRYTDVSWHYNAEVAPLAMFTEADPALRYGFRFGVMIGRSALQLRALIPWVGVGGEIEVFPNTDGRSLLLNLKGGLRAGVDWDF